jgi:hypothetical protein
MPKGANKKEEKKLRNKMLQESLKSSEVENANIDKFKIFVEKKYKLLEKLAPVKLNNIFIEAYNKHKDETVRELSQYVHGGILDIINDPNVNVKNLIENNLAFEDRKNILVNGVLSKIKLDYKEQCGVEIEDEKIIDLDNDVLKVYLLDLLFNAKDDNHKLDIAGQIIGMLFSDIMEEYDDEMDLYDGDEPRNIVQTMEHINQTFETMNEVIDGGYDSDLLRKIIEKHKLEKNVHFKEEESKIEPDKHSNKEIESKNEFCDTEVKPEKINIDKNVSDYEEEKHEKPISKLMPQSKNSNWGKKIEENPYSKYQNEYERQNSNKSGESAKREGSVRSSSSIKVGGMEFIENRDGKGKETERSFSSVSKDGSVKSIKGERHPNLKEVSKRLKNATMEHGNQDEKRGQSLNKSGMFTSKETTKNKDPKHGGKDF